MATITIATVLDQFKVQLDARGGLSGVTVTTGPTGDPPPESIEFSDVDITDEYFGMGNPPSKLATYTISGQVFVRRPGKGEAAIKLARDRAVAIVEEVRDEVTGNITVGAATLHASFSTASMRQGVTDPASRTCTFDFTVEIEDNA